MVMKKKKVIIGIIIGVVVCVLAFLGVCVAIAIKDLKQEAILKQEIINYSNKKLESDDYTIEVKTTGDYAYVEEAIKKYFKDLSDNIKAVNKYLTDEEFTTLLAPSSLSADRPSYSNSQNKLKETKENVNKHLEAINKLCDVKTVQNLLDKEKLDDYDYYNDFYLKLMYTEKDKEALESLKKEMDTIISKFNEFLDKADEILSLLEKNDGVVQFKDNIIYFTSSSVLNEYNTKVRELQTMAKSFSTITSQNTNTTKSKEYSEV